MRKNNLLKDIPGTQYLTPTFVANQRKNHMIDCKECIEYAHTVLARGEIGVEDINKLALDRHILKGCDSVPSVGYGIANKLPMDIICNNFSLKNVIIETLQKYRGQGVLDDGEIEMMAEDIKEAFAVKLGIRQG